MPKLSNTDRYHIIGMLKAGRTRTYIAAQFNVSMAAVGNLLHRYHETDNMTDRQVRQTQGDNCRWRPTDPDDVIAIKNNSCCGNPDCYEAEQGKTTRIVSRWLVQVATPDIDV